MFSVAYRSSVFSIASNASRRVYHSSIKSVKNSVPFNRQQTTQQQSGRTKKFTTDAAKKTEEKSAEAAETTAAKEASTTAATKKSWVEENPFVFQLGVATCKTSAADLIAQCVVEKKSLSEVDWKRNSIFVVFGFAYLGGFQYWLQVTKYRQWFPTMDSFAKLPFAAKLKDTAGMIEAVKMVLFDVIIHLPVIYFPVYYTMKEFVSGATWNPIDWMKDGVTKYIGNSKDDLTAMIKLWGPADCIQFVLPIHIRLPFRHLVSFFWTAYVSFTRGSIDDATEDPVTKAETMSLQRAVTTSTPEPKK